MVSNSKNFKIKEFKLLVQKPKVLNLNNFLYFKQEKNTKTYNKIWKKEISTENERKIIKKILILIILVFLASEVNIINISIKKKRV